ncbi:hypothetical protein [Streptomyces sp. NPDC057617]|uniref:hypothetical protein n=1 Tax=Streptomyces sp. NPDC057617 TaxID=3346184 RepID=UPI0036940C8F
MINESLIMPPEQMRRVSAKLFGNRYRAELMLALAHAGTQGVCMGDLAVRYGVQSSVYRAPMGALMSLGLAEALPAVAGERRRWHRITAQSSLWPFLRPLLDCLAEETSPAQVE